MSVPQPPAVSTAARRAYDSLPESLTAPDAAADFALLALMAALTTGSDEIWSVVEDPGADEYLTPANAPPRWLPWLGLPAGVRVDPRVADAFPDVDLVAAVRAEISDAPNMDRGPEAYLRAKLAPRLSSVERLRVAQFTSPTEPGRHSHELTIRVPLDDLRDDQIIGTRAATNLVPDPELAETTSHRGARYATLARSTTTPGPGPFALRVTPTTEGPYFDDVVTADVGDLVGTTSVAIPAGFATLGIHHPGERLQARVRVLNPNAVPVRAPLRLETGGLWPQIIAQVVVTLMPGESTVLTLDATVPEVPAWEDAGLDLPTWEDVPADFPTWTDLHLGHPSWASLQDVGARLVFGGPMSLETGQFIVGGGLLWSAPQVNQGTILNDYGHGDADGWDWDGDPYTSASVRPDTRQSPAFIAAAKALLPAGLLGHVLLDDGQSSWEDLPRMGGRDTWIQTADTDPSWDVVRETYYPEG